MRVLVWLYVGPPPSARSTALARELNVSDPTVSDAVAALLRKKLVVRRRDPLDGRSHRLGSSRPGRPMQLERRNLMPSRIPAHFG
ncbi:MAG TPA: helix-turn-helix domain-containing protein [Mycobacterium sp.]